MAQKIAIKNDGVCVDGAMIPGVMRAEIKNINPGPTGSMEVALIFLAREVDICYKQRATEPNDFAKEIISRLDSC